MAGRSTVGKKKIPEASVIVTSRRLISNALPFGRLWYGEPNAASNAVDYAKFRSRSHDAVIRVYDEAGYP